MRIISNIGGLCCWDCLDDVWQLVHESFHSVSLVLCCFPEMLQSQKIKLRVKKRLWNK